MATVASAISFKSGYRKKTADPALSLCNYFTKGPAFFCPVRTVLLGSAQGAEKPYKSINYQLVSVFCKPLFA